MSKSSKEIRFKKNEEHDFTKVVWKLCIKPVNCPASKQISEQYEVSWEFKCTNEELAIVEKVISDTEERLTDLAINTQFMIKSKTIHCNYEELQSTLGYEPDAMEFDAYLKKLLKQCQHQILNDSKVPVAS